MMPSPIYTQLPDVDDDPRTTAVANGRQRAFPGQNSAFTPISTSGIQRSLDDPHPYWILEHGPHINDPVGNGGWTRDGNVAAMNTSQWLADQENARLFSNGKNVILPQQMFPKFDASSIDSHFLGRRK